MSGFYAYGVLPQGGEDRITELAGRPILFHEGHARLAVVAADHHAAGAPHVILVEAYPELPVLFPGNRDTYTSHFRLLTVSQGMASLRKILLRRVKSMNRAIAFHRITMDNYGIS